MYGLCILCLQDPLLCRGFGAFGGCTFEALTVDSDCSLALTGHLSDIYFQERLILLKACQISYEAASHISD